MNETIGGLEIVTDPSGDWCDANTGTCHLGTDDAPTAETDSETTADGVVDAVQGRASASIGEWPGFGASRSTGASPQETVLATA